MHRVVWAALVAAGTAVAPAWAAARTDLFPASATLDRDELLAAVLSRNPNLEAARQAWRAAESRSPQARSFADPTVSYGVAPLSIGRAGGIDLGQEIRLEQMLPYPERRRLRIDAAEAAAAIARREVERVGQDLVLRCAVLFAEWYRVHRALEVNAQHRTLMAELQQVATARYAAGLAGQQDPLQAESELAELLHEQVFFETEREIAVAEINALLHRAPDAVLPPPPTELPAPEAFAGGDLAAEALRQRPEIRALDAMIQEREIEAALARLERRPDLEIMAAYNSMWSDTEHRLMLGATVNLPVRKSRIQAAITEAEAQLEAARAQRAGAEDNVRREVAVAAMRLREAHHLLEILRSRLVPAARDRVDAATAGFTTGRSDFAALVDAQRNLWDAELEVAATLADLQRRHAELQRAMGLPPIESVASSTAFSGFAGTVAEPAQRDPEGATP